MWKVFVPALVAALVATPVTADSGWQPLITAETLPGWTIEGESKADFKIDGDVVRGQPVGNNPKNSFLCSPREYRNFDLAFAFRITPTTLNSGVQFRSRVRADGIVAGPQLEMEVEDPSDVGFLKRWVYPTLVRLTDNPWRPRYWASGGIYGEGLETGWIYPGVAGGEADSFAEQGERITDPEGWNELRLLADGSQVKTWLNGQERADFRYDRIDGPGLICLQVHGGQYEDPTQYKIEWKGLRIRER